MSSRKAFYARSPVIILNIRRANNKQESEQVETRNPYQPPCLHALFFIQPQPRDRHAPPLIGLRAL